jgi:hypothetical protein
MGNGLANWTNDGEKITALNSRLDSLPTEAIHFEKLGAEIIVSPEWEPISGHANPVLIKALRSRGDAAAQTLLAAVAAISSSETPSEAPETPRLLVDQVGQLEIDRAWQHPFGSRTILYALLAKPGQRPHAFAWFAVQRENDQQLVCGQFRSLLPHTPERTATEQAIKPAAFSTTISSHLENSLQAGRALPVETAITLSLLATSIGVDAETFNRLAIELPPPNAVTVDPLNSTEVYEVMDRFLPEFESFVESNYAGSPDIARMADFVGGAMLEFKGRFGSGAIYSWSKSDIYEFLMSWFPNRVALNAEDWPSIPPTGRAFLNYLSERELLVNQCAEDLNMYMDSLVPLFFARMKESQYSVVIQKAIEPESRS